MRVIVLGGAGNFGARIVRALGGDRNIELLSAGRRALAVPGAPQVTTVALDIAADDFPARLAALAPHLVIHCVGPFQGQDYRVAEAALAAGAHYLDLADGRDFVADFARHNDAKARAAGRCAVSGASTLPALSAAVLDELCNGLQPRQIDICIAPGQKAPRGAATLAAVFSYLGSAVSVWEEGGWRARTGWMDLRRVRLDFATRWAALCDVPDLALLPARYPGLRSARFHAALEFGIEHFALWLLAACRRIGPPLPVRRWAIAMNGMAGWLDARGGEWGGMRVSVLGVRGDGRRVRRNWLLTTPAVEGPEIPCMAAILLARRIAAGEAPPPPGAAACAGFLRLDEFAPLFAQWNMRIRIEESLA
ncbi:MAG: saccharopine dehydrogenase NADP-binding domain-containing protein [Pseudomonadota bacterium]